MSRESQFPSLLGLSTEIQICIVSYLSSSRPTLLALSRTSKQLHAVTAHSLYSSITLRNDEKSGASVQALAKSPNAHLVKTLHFEGYIDLPENKRIRRPAQEDLSESVQIVLKKISHHFSKCASLSVEFPSMKMEWKPDFSSFDDHEPRDTAREEESNDARNNLMFRVYTCIAANSPSSITSLTLLNLLSTEITSWSSEPFRKLLHGLDSFSVSIRDGDNGPDWCMMTRQSYSSVLGDIDRLFLGHISNVHTLSLAAAKSSPAGLSIPGCQSIPWLMSHGRNLRILRLEHMFIGQTLFELLRGCADTLEELYLTNFYSGAGGDFDFWHSDNADNAPTWADLFRHLVALAPPRLHKVDVSPLRVFLRASEPTFDKEICEKARFIDQLVAKGYGREDGEREEGLEKWDRVFAYFYIGGCYQIPVWCDRVALRRWEEGEDRRAWGTLMGLVEGNAKRKEGKVGL